MDSHLLCFFLRNATVAVCHNRYLFHLGCPFLCFLLLRILHILIFLLQISQV